MLIWKNNSFNLKLITTYIKHETLKLNRLKIYIFLFS